ncbi:unnamed protein product [Caenorhabditis angaria]|uniref:Uncharacterized protein n=1 Tax=Caenorhabditis angaria TaxID=860376 RepID=A0A9P1IFQ3_9PELO|nr:unnamed protein product [Caenorhabditis angaria]
MKFLILIFLLSSTQKLVSTETAAERAGIDLLIYMFECESQRNPEFVHADYEAIDKFGVISHKSEADKEILALSDSDIAKRVGVLGMLRNLTLPLAIPVAFPFTFEFTKDAMLYVKDHENEKLKSLLLYKRDTTVKGGYKAYRYVEIA